MGHVTSETDWCTIDINTSTGQIVFQERWQYNWLIFGDVPDWTLSEKRCFHQRADDMIWGVWSNRGWFQATGVSDFARQFAGRKLPISFDIRWVTSDRHWLVSATKVPDGYRRHPSRIDWKTRQVFICSEDFKRDRHAGGIVAHEFGHAVGNSWVMKRGDEYKETSPHHKDKASVMNTGRQVRPRHFRTIIDALNKMMPDTRFVVGGVQ